MLLMKTAIPKGMESFRRLLQEENRPFLSRLLYDLHCLRIQSIRKTSGQGCSLVQSLIVQNLKDFIATDWHLVKREGLPFSFRCPRTWSTQASPGYTRVSEIGIPRALYHGGSIPNQLAPILIRRTRNSESMQLQHEVMGPCYALIACWLQVLQISVLFPMYIKAK